MSRERRPNTSSRYVIIFQLDDIETITFRSLFMSCLSRYSLQDFDIASLKRRDEGPDADAKSQLGVSGA